MRCGNRADRLKHRPGQIHLCISRAEALVVPSSASDRLQLTDSHNQPTSIGASTGALRRGTAVTPSWPAAARLLDWHERRSGRSAVGPRRLRACDTLVVTKLDRMARSLPDACCVLDELTRRSVEPSGRSPLAERRADPGMRSGGEKTISPLMSRQRLDVGRREAGELECALVPRFRVLLRIELRVRSSTGALTVAPRSLPARPTKRACAA